MRPGKCQGGGRNIPRVSVYRVREPGGSGDGGATGFYFPLKNCRVLLALEIQSATLFHP